MKKIEDGGRHGLSVECVWTVVELYRQGHGPLFFFLYLCIEFLIFIKKI